MTTITASVAENPPSRISKGPRVAMFADAFSKEPKECELSAILEAVKSGRYEKQISQLRELRAMDGEAYQKEKRSLPAFCISGTAASRTEPLTHSGLLQVDIDILNGTLDNIREELKVDPHVYFGFVSPSGDGLKLGLRIDGERHGDSFTAAQNYFKLRYGLEIDPLVKDKLRLCFVSHDPELWTSENAKPLPIPEVGNRQSEAAAPPRGIIILPSSTITISEAAREIFERIAPSREMFWRGGALVELVNQDGAAILDLVKPEAFRSRVERYGNPMVWRSGANGESVLKPCAMPRDAANAIMATSEAREILPSISSVLSCAVLTQTSTGEITILGQGYHPDEGGLLIVAGTPPPRVELAEAVSSLKGPLDEFDFQSEGDRSRALAAIITPALRMGGHIKGPLPIDVAEADQPQAGKGFRHTLTSAFYSASSYLVTARHGGVGSLDESLAAALVAGRQFICFDNLRGHMDSQYLEAFTTSTNLFPARIPHRGEILIDPKKFILQLSSNGFEATPDLAKRSSICRIRKRPGFAYRDTLAEVQSRQPFFLGCIFTIVAEWIASGKPRTREHRHDFREWCQTLDYIVQHILGCAPLMDGHEAAQERVSNPALSWLRAVALAVESEGRLDAPFIASELCELCDLHNLDIPGDPKNEDESKKQVGRLFRRVFNQGDRVALDGYQVERTITSENREHGGALEIKRYTFTRP